MASKADKKNVLVVGAHKGGSGKSSTVASLASYFAQKKNMSCLIIDFDEQCQQKTLWNLRLSGDYEGGLASVLIDKLMPESMIQKTAVPNIDVILSGGRKIKEFEALAFQNRDCLTRMAQLGQSLKSKYDIIICDTAPAIGALSVNAFSFASHALLVSEPDLLGAMGARATEQFISKEIGGDLKLDIPKILGVVFTRFDARRAADNNAQDEMDTYAVKGHLGGGRVFEPIRQDAKLRTAQARRRTIYDYAPKSNVAVDYASLGEEILKDMGLSLFKESHTLREVSL